MLRDPRTALTYLLERRRAVATGIIETAATTFMLLVAVRWFQAGAFAKACVAAGAGVGYLVAPVLVTWVEATQVPVALASARLAALGAIVLAIAVVVPGLAFFVIASVVAAAAVGAMSPLLTQIYQDNYPAFARGRLYSRAVMIRIVSAALFSGAAGYLLSIRLEYYRGLLAVFSLALAYSAWCLAKVPSTPLHISGGRHPLRAFRHARDDRVFRTTLISWMLMGFANLMMLPLRIEYLANPKYALAFRPDVIALLTGVVPGLARLVMSPMWGWLFDRVNFFILRMALNVGFAVGIVSFFTSDTMVGLALAAMAYGISIAGGDVAWSLWVTKVAPPRRVADYMSIHTFFTGLRGLMAPMIGFALATRWSMTSMCWLAAGLILAGTLLLLPEARRGGLLTRPAPPGTPAPLDPGETT